MSVRCLTPVGPGGVAVVSMTGKHALGRLAELCGGLPSPGRLVLVHPLRDGEVLDEALLVSIDEEHHELHLHGSPPLVEELLELLGAKRPDAESGNHVDCDPGACDLGDGEHESAIPAIGPGVTRRLLGSALTDSGARLLLDRLEGSWGRTLDELARLEGDRLAARAGGLWRHGVAARRLWVPPRVLIVGPVNAGKSTLFNVLLGQGRTLVSSEAGTTRDAVHELTRLGAWPVELIDSAGERELARGEAPGGTPGETPAETPAEALARTPGAAGLDVERAGQDRAQELARGADLLLRLEPADGPLPGTAPGDGRVVGLLSRRDLASGGVPGEAVSAGWYPISAREDPTEVRGLLSRLLCERLELPPEPWIPGQGVALGEEVEVLERIARTPDPRDLALLGDLLEQDLGGASG